MKKSAKDLRNPYSVHPSRPPNIKCIVRAFFGERFVEKDGDLHAHNPSAEEVRGFEVFSYYGDPNFEHQLQ
jgi:hypothetical protein